MCLTFWIKVRRFTPYHSDNPVGPDLETRVGAPRTSVLRAPTRFNLSAQTLPNVIRLVGPVCLLDEMPTTEVHVRLFCKIGLIDPSMSSINVVQLFCHILLGHLATVTPFSALA